uniref:Uncharacterized protein n=1 Tax=Meloidogyne hapla TaxID=6305 RepID=A0A1I8BPP4_MELHA
MNSLILSVAAALLLFFGFLGNFPRLPQNIYLPPNDPTMCIGELYKHENQLPLLQGYKSIYEPVKLKINGKEKIAPFYEKDTITDEDFQRVYKRQEKWLKDLMIGELIFKKLLLNELNKKEMIEHLKELGIEKEELINEKEIKVGELIIKLKEKEIDKLMEEGTDIEKSMTKEKVKEEKIEERLTKGKNEQIKNIIDKINKMVQKIKNKVNYDKDKKEEEEKIEEIQTLYRKIKKYNKRKGRIVIEDMIEIMEKIKDFEIDEIEAKEITKKVEELETEEIVKNLKDEFEILMKETDMEEIIEIGKALKIGKDKNV